MATKIGSDGEHRALLTKMHARAVANLALHPRDAECKAKMFYNVPYNPSDDCFGDTPGPCKGQLKGEPELKNDQFRGGPVGVITCRLKETSPLMLRVTRRFGN